MHVKIYGYKETFYDHIDKYTCSKKNVDCLNFPDRLKSTQPTYFNHCH